MEDFITAYLECALWCTSDESDDSGGVPLDDTFTIDDIDDTTRAAMEADCRAFYEAWEPLWRGKLSDDRAGHDFWLTRHGHGTGFWDEGLGPDFDLGSPLSRYCKAYGEFHLWADFEAGKVRS